MTKRREFIKGAAVGLVTTIGGVGFVSICKPAPKVEDQNLLKKNWQEDPEWNKLKYGDWENREYLQKLGQWMIFIERLCTEIQ